MFKGSWAVIVAWLVAGCSEPFDTAVVLTPSTLGTTDPTARARLAAFAGGPYMLVGALTACHGAPARRRPRPAVGLAIECLTECRAAASVAAFGPSLVPAACYAGSVQGRLLGATAALLAAACGGTESAGAVPHPPLEIGADSWQSALVDEDPFVSESQGRVRCSPFAVRLEAGWLEVKTTDCNYATLVHHFSEDVLAGDRINGEVAWATLASLEPAIGTLAFATAEQGVLWTHEVSIPGEAGIERVELTFAHDAPAGTALYFHVRNHGYNTWQLSPLELTDPPG